MNKDETLKLALEALEWINRVNAMDYEYQQKAREALNEIYEALAQPEQEPVAKLAGVAYVDDLDLWHFYPMRETDNFPDGTKFYTTPPQRPWVGLTEANMEVLIEQARVVPNQVPCPDYNERLLVLTNAVLKELNT